jgi:hypothetical protein
MIFSGKTRTVLLLSVLAAQLLVGYPHASSASGPGATIYDPAECGLAIVGIGVGRSADEPPWALVRNLKTGEEESFEVKDSVFGVGSLTSITRDEVQLVLASGGVARFRLGGVAGKSTEKNSRADTSRTVVTNASWTNEEFRKNFTEAATKMVTWPGRYQAEERVIDGQEESGLTFVNISDDILLAKLGVRSNDFIYSLNDSAGFDLGLLFNHDHFAPNPDTNEIVIKVIRDGVPHELRTKVPLS